MSYRKKRLILIQTLLLFAAILLFYIFYYQNNNSSIQNKKVETESEKLQKMSEDNFFEDVEYKGIDSNGNRYLLNSKIASFDENNPELVKMIEMNATFYFKNGKTLKVSGKSGM